MTDRWTWWLQLKMKTFSALLVICEGIPPVTGGFPSQRPVTRSFDIFLICARTNDWANNRDGGDLRRHRAHHAVKVMRSLNTTTFITFEVMGMLILITQKRRLGKCRLNQFANGIGVIVNQQQRKIIHFRMQHVPLGITYVNPLKIDPPRSVQCNVVSHWLGAFTKRSPWIWYKSSINSQLKPLCNRLRWSQSTGTQTSGIEIWISQYGRLYTFWRHLRLIYVTSHCVKTQARHRVAQRFRTHPCFFQYQRVAVKFN